jgi:DHA3 family macrolide efflux protein-like MFS transporter
MGFLKALRLPQIALLWTSQVLSAMGDYFYTIAVMWIAVKTSGSDAGFVAGAEAVAMFVFGLLGGVYADRWNRRVTMVAVDLARAVAVLLLPILALSGRLQFWHLVVVAVIIGSLSALFDPALQASLPALTGGDTQALQATNGLMDITRRLARTLGPSLAGLLVAFLPLAHFFTLDAISFAISALAVLSLGSRFAWKPQRVEEQKQRGGIKAILREAAGGIRLVSSHRPLLWSLLAVAVSNFVWSIAFVVGVPLLVAHGLGKSVGAYGLIVGAYGIGNVLSNLIIGSLTIKRVLTIFLGKGILGLGFLLLGLSSSVPMALFASALAALGGPMGDIMILTMLQTNLPSDQIGKAYSLSMVLESSGAALGLLLAVPLFNLVSVPLGIALSALLLLIVSVFGLWRFGRREPETRIVAGKLAR